MPKQQQRIKAGELASHFKKTRQTVHNWTKEGMPHRSDGKESTYVLSECIEWRIAEEREDALARAAKASESIDEAKERARKLRAEADLKELELLVQRREVMPTAVHLQRIEEIAAGFASVANGKLTRFEREIVAVGTPGDARRVTQRIAEALMQGVHEFTERLEDPDEEAA
jgi:phage terminase Nu1 subunit (DNA packaging protein)